MDDELKLQVRVNST